MEVISPALRSLGLYATRNHLKEEMANLKRLTQLRHLLLQANPFPNNAVHEMVRSCDAHTQIHTQITHRYTHIHRYT